MLSSAENMMCLGHEAARACFEDAFSSGRLPPVWLLVGPEGVGKRTLAYHFIRSLFAPGCSVSLETPFVRRLVADSHGDFFLLKDSQVEGVRQLRSFLQKAPVEGQVRIALLPHVDQLTPAATNALLKTLEEPAEQTFFFLTARNQGSLLPTLRSRCRVLTLSPLDRERFGAHLEVLCPAQRLARPLPQVIFSLWESTGGCLGQAMRVLEAGHISNHISFSQIIEAGIRAYDHPDFKPPFHAQHFTFWTETPQEKIAEGFLHWTQQCFVHSSSATGPQAQREIWAQKTPLEWGYIYDRLRGFLAEAHLFKSDPLFSAMTAFAILKGDY